MMMMMMMMMMMLLLLYLVTFHHLPPCSKIQAVDFHHSFPPLTRYRQVKRKEGSISIWNNGAGLPVQVTREKKTVFWMGIFLWLNFLDGDFVP